MLSESYIKLRVWDKGHEIPGSGTKGLPLHLVALLPQTYMQRTHQYHNGSHARTFEHMCLEKAFHYGQM